jgi:hypothetical protein
MPIAQNDPIQQTTDAIYARLLIQWEALKTKDAASNDAVIFEDFESISPDGIRRIGKPTVEQMAEQPISGYKLSQFRVVPLAADSALVTYLSDIETPSDNGEHQMAIGEYWIKRGGNWFIRAFSGTLLK